MVKQHLAAVRLGRPDTDPVLDSLSALSHMERSPQQVVRRSVVELAVVALQDTGAGVLEPLDRAVDGAEIEVGKALNRHRTTDHVLGILPELRARVGGGRPPAEARRQPLLLSCVKVSQTSDTGRSLAATKLVLQDVKVVEVQRTCQHLSVVDPGRCGLLATVKSRARLIAVQHVYDVLITDLATESTVSVAAPEGPHGEDGPELGGTRVPRPLVELDAAAEVGAASRHRTTLTIAEQLRNRVAHFRLDKDKAATTHHLTTAGQLRFRLPRGQWVAERPQLRVSIEVVLRHIELRALSV